MTVRFTLRWQSNPLSLQRLCTSAGKLLPFRRASSPTRTYSKAGCPVTCDDIKPGAVSVVPCRLKRFRRRRMLPTGGACDEWKNSREE